MYVHVCVCVYGHVHVDAPRLWRHAGVTGLVGTLSQLARQRCEDVLCSLRVIIAVHSSLYCVRYATNDSAAF